jgi:hypothetical protein
MCATACWPSALLGLLFAAVAAAATAADGVFMLCRYLNAKKAKKKGKAKQAAAEQEDMVRAGAADSDMDPGWAWHAWPRRHTLGCAVHDGGLPTVLHML